MGFRLVLTSMNLNDLEAYFAFFSLNSIPLPTNYVTVVEDITSVNTVSQFQSSILGITNPPCSAVSAIAEHLV